MTGDWETWTRFFLTGVQETAEDAARTAKRLMAVAATDEKRIQEIGRSAGSALRLHRLLQKRPIVSIGSASGEIGLSVPAIDKALQRLVARGGLRRLSRGLYDKPRHDEVLGTLWPSVDAVVQALVGKHKLRVQPAGAYAANLLGLSEQVPA